MNNQQTQAPQVQFVHKNKLTKKQLGLRYIFVPIVLLFLIVFTWVIVNALAGAFASEVVEGNKNTNLIRWVINFILYILMGIDVLALMILIPIGIVHLFIKD